MLSDSAPTTAEPTPRKASRFRAVLFWIHLVFGLSAGVIILVMSVTGAILGFERQIIAAIDGAPSVTAHETDARLHLDTLLARARIERAAVASLALRAGPTDVVTVRFRERERVPVALNPYTGDKVEIPSGGKTAAFMSALRRWHRWLGAAAEPARGRARMFTGAANLMFLFLVMSGFYLWWPRRWTRAIVRSVTVPSVTLRAKARDFNWHNSIGFWSAIPLFFVVASAVFMSYQWPGRWLDRAFGSPAEKKAAIEAGAARAPAPTPPRPPVTPPALVVRDGDATLDAWMSGIANAKPEWKTATITMPGARDSVVQVAVAEGNTYKPTLRTTLSLDPATGATRSARGYEALSTSRKIRAWVRFGHTGEVFGVAGQTIATIVSLAGAFLVWTGIALALRRASAWWGRRKRVALASR